MNLLLEPSYFYKNNEYDLFGNIHFLDTKPNNIMEGKFTKLIFSNEEFIKNMIDEKTIIRDLNLQNYTKLFKIKTRTNAIRIWKIFFLSVYLSTLSID